MSFKAFNDLAPVQFLWLHIFTHPHLYPTTLVTPILSVILPQLFILSPTYLLMCFTLPRKPLILLFSWHPLISQIQQRNCILPKNLFVSHRLPTSILFIEFVPLSCFLLFILLFSVYLIVFPIKLFLKIRDYDFSL